MEAHLVLSLASYPVISFGTGSAVRLPGPSIDKPNIYAFNSTTYDEMYQELKHKDPRLYTANGLLGMLDRNRHIKGSPERWQDWKVGVPRKDGVQDGVVDVVFTCEERCWDIVVEGLYIPSLLYYFLSPYLTSKIDLLNRNSPLNRLVHIINVDIKDNHEEAVVGGKGILELAHMLTAAAKEEREKYGEAYMRDSVDKRVPEVLASWQEKFPNLPALWTVGYF
jgi:RNA polymerase II subunit A C-terminal domain phosphatase SSU72